MNPQVSQYIDSATPEQKQIMETLRRWIRESVPGAVEEFKWSRPVFRAAKDFAYLKTAKAYVTLGFFDFEKLDDPGGLLEGTGKDMRHIKIKKASDLDRELLQAWFRAAAN